MRRRKFLVLVGMVAMMPPVSASAQQQGKARRIGFLAARSQSTRANPDVYYDAFVQGLRDSGYVDGQNIVIEWRFAEGKFERLPVLAAELVKRNVEVVVTHGTQAAQVLQRATRTIPIVFVAVGNPVESGLVSSLARPGGNVTGQSNMVNEVAPKQVQLLKDLNPKLSRIAMLFNPSNTTSLAILDNVNDMARQLGMTVLPVNVYSPDDLDRAFVQITGGKAEAFIVAPDNLFVAIRERVVRAASKSRLPGIYPFSEDVGAGGLMSYGPVQAEVYRRGAIYVDKILKGSKPADLPVEQPTKFELTINKKAARAIGISFPQAILGRVDRVIE